MSPFTKKSETLLDSVHQILTENTVTEAVAPAMITKIKGQCTYVVHFKEKQVTNHHGVTELLGYTAEEFNFDAILAFVHPDDADSLIRLIYATADYASQHVASPDLILNITCRIRKKDGNYIKVLAQSVIYHKDNDGRAISHYTILTDISFMHSNGNLEWKFEAPQLDHDKFKSYVNKSGKCIFSKREIEVLELVNKGFTSNVIAEKLYLSKHTIDTHRRKMLQKTGCSNVIELLEYYRINVL